MLECPFSRLNDIPLCIDHFFSHSSVVGHLGCIHLVAIVHYAAVYERGGADVCEILLRFSWVHNSAVGLLDPVMVVLLVF